MISKHAEIRLEQRYAIKVDSHFKNCVANDIITCQSIFYKKISTRKAFHFVKYKNIPYQVLYDNQNKKIITVYPLDIEAYNALMNERDKKNSDYHIEFLKKRFKDSKKANKNKLTKDEISDKISKAMKKCHSEGRHPGWSHINLDKNKRSYLGLIS